MWKEFKEFISRGNVLNLAVGVIMGSSFTAIVNALVDNIIMPFIGIILGGLSFTDLSIKIGSSVIRYGAFIQAVVNFLIISFVLFLMVKAMSLVEHTRDELLQVSRQKEADEKQKAKDKVDVEIELLKEIRDLLSEKDKTGA